jgi:putative transposase
LDLLLAALLITENLSHLFTYNKPKSINRKLSSWLRGEIQDRISFKALAEGFRHEQVNPAYSSQICPSCDFVDSKNRIKDKFTCLHCRHEDIADRVAAQNLAKRYGDDFITLYTPYSEVKTIQLGRFHRRLEAEQSATVPGRTLETVSNMKSTIFCRDTIIAGREQSRYTGRSIRERNKNKYV